VNLEDQLKLYHKEFLQELDKFSQTTLDFCDPNEPEIALQMMAEFWAFLAGFLITYKEGIGIAPPSDLMIFAKRVQDACQELHAATIPKGGLLN